MRGRRLTGVLVSSVLTAQGRLIGCFRCEGRAVRTGSVGGGGGGGVTVCGGLDACGVGGREVSRVGRGWGLQRQMCSVCVCVFVCVVCICVCVCVCV